MKLVQLENLFINADAIQLIKIVEGGGQRFVDVYFVGGKVERLPGDIGDRLIRALNDLD